MRRKVNYNKHVLDFYYHHFYYGDRSKVPFWYDPWAMHCEGWI